MSNARTSSAPASGPASRTEREVPRALDEATYLRLQVEEAERALAETIEELGEDLKGLLDVRAWARLYPLPSLGASALAGFVAARHLGSRPPWISRRRLERLLDRIEQVKRAQASVVAGFAPPPREPTFLKPILGSVLDVLKATAIAAVTEAIAARAQMAAAHPDGAPPGAPESPSGGPDGAPPRRI